MAGLAAGVALLVLLGGSTKAAGLAWQMFAGLFGLAAAGLMLTTNAASRANSRARPFLLYLGALLAAATIAVWLSTDRAALRLLLFPAWPLIGILLRRGTGANTPRLALWLPAWLVLAALLLWVDLVLSVQLRATSGSQWNVYSGWPFAAYIGAVRGNTPPLDRGPVGAWWLDHAVMLGIAAVALWRRPVAWLATWLPVLCGLLALAHLVGTYWLAFATDG